MRSNVKTMKFGIRWYVGVGEHGYKEDGHSEYRNMAELLKGLHMTVSLDYSEEALFEALCTGQDEDIYWVTDDFGFSFYRP